MLIVHGHPPHKESIEKKNENASGKRSGFQQTAAGYALESVYGSDTRLGNHGVRRKDTHLFFHCEKGCFTAQGCGYCWLPTPGLGLALPATSYYQTSILSVE